MVQTMKNKIKAENTMKKTKETTKTTNIAPILPPTLFKDVSQVSLRSYALIFSEGTGKKVSPINSLVGHSGNLKIPSHTAIFNMSSANDCPSKKLGLCKAAKAGVKCYALKAEYEYHPDVLPYRRRQEAYWKSVTANQFVADFLLMNACKVKPFKSIRFNEAGDFHSQKCIDKAERIAMLLSRFGIVCYCYTSRSDLKFTKCKYLIISGSGFKRKGISNQFRIVKDLKDRPKGFGVCKGNCRICDRCLIRGRKTVVMAH